MRSIRNHRRATGAERTVEAVKATPDWTASTEDGFDEARKTERNNQRTSGKWTLTPWGHLRCHDIDTTQGFHTGSGNLIGHPAPGGGQYMEMAHHDGTPDGSTGTR